MENHGQPDARASSRSPVWTVGPTHLALLPLCPGHWQGAGLQLAWPALETVPRGCQGRGWQPYPLRHNASLLNPHSLSSSFPSQGPPRRSAFHCHVLPQSSPFLCFSFRTPHCCLKATPQALFVTQDISCHSHGHSS